ncbi:hypothetical protein CYY_006338 [Polysphondylium violaceum]|uniref:peptidylprolyl isomerase n=1 Tax=Polysphondylium violaceum TaxID=133409 RepID=A0A8J4UZ17_9MYCE|nr:hypothetical protein CYY_006338 [Polysphondylium violaceum]
MSNKSLTSSGERLIGSNSPPLKKPGVQLDSDGCLIKRVLKEGYSDTTPPPKSIVSILYEGYLSNNNIFDSNVQQQNRSPFTFQLGTNSAIEAIEIAVATMKLGEEAEIVTTQRFGFGKLGLPPFIPPNTTIIYKVQLLSIQLFEDIDNNTGISFNNSTSIDVFDIWIKKALKEKELGNQYFNSNNYKKAIRHYIKSIWLLNDPRLGGVSFSGDKEQNDSNSSNSKQLKDLLIVLYLNLASCNIKLQDGNRAIANCEKVAEMGGNTAKFYFKMGQAYSLNKQYESAKRCLVQAIRLEPNDKILRDELEKIKLNLN